MSYIKRLDHAFQNAPILPITPCTRYVFFSDCHRGTGNNNDNFLPNAESYLTALHYYYRLGFCYIEAGDGDELWERCHLDWIVDTYPAIFAQLSCFHQSGRFYMLYGNHDMEKRKTGPYFADFKVHEGIILCSTCPALKIHVTHGHQADLLNSVFWRLARFLVRHLWRPLEALGIQNPTSASKSSAKKRRLETRYRNYAQTKDILLLAGHTHKPVLGSRLSPYFNCGSCVSPNCITCIELTGYEISLVRWCNGQRKREVLATEHLL